MKLASLGICALFIGTTSFADTVLTLKGETAKEVFGKMKVEGNFDGAYHTTKKAEGKLTCTQRVPTGGAIKYFCNFEFGLLSIKGSAAQDVFENFHVEGKFDGAYHTFKSASGTLTCVSRLAWNVPGFYQCNFDTQ